MNEPQGNFWGNFFTSHPLPEFEAWDRPKLCKHNPRRLSVCKLIAAAEKALPESVSRYVMARDLAGPVFPVSEDLVLREARKHGIGRKMGRVIIFSPDDIQRLYEVMPCPSSSFAGQIAALDHPRHPPGNPR